LFKSGFGKEIIPNINSEKTIGNNGLIENGLNQNFIRTSLIIVPNSLVFNWQNEAKKFTPNLKVLVYTGTQRIKK
jgi:SNF2 family DNA or RNA helicase